MLYRCMHVVPYYVCKYISNYFLCYIRQLKIQFVFYAISHIAWKMRDPQEGADDVLDQEWEKEQRRELEEDIRIIQ